MRSRAPASIAAAVASVVVCVSSSLAFTGAPTPRPAGLDYPPPAPATAPTLPAPPASTVPPGASVGTATPVSTIASPKFSSPPDASSLLARSKIVTDSGGRRRLEGQILVLADATFTASELSGLPSDTELLAEWPRDKLGVSRLLVSVADSELDSATRIMKSLHGVSTRARTRSRRQRRSRMTQTGLDRPALARA